MTYSFNFFEIDTATPETIVEEQLAVFFTSSESHCFISIVYPVEQYWLPEKPIKRLQALYQLKDKEPDANIVFSVFEHDSRQYPNLEGYESLGDLCHAHGWPLFESNRLAVLSSLSIKKPWGQEIWYTGIEQRGVANVIAENGQACLLPWYLSALPNRLCGERHKSLILLKILDPSPKEVVGDLYFELHEEKREVYVVTAVDKAAWPSGEGAIRFGFDQELLANYADEADFKSDFVASVKAYEGVRRQIDQLLDDDGVELSAISPSLLSEERTLRAAMESFTAKRSLRLGDVVKVPCLTPHSLQHGVRTVEFQTPVYERLILSFAQKVLTQSHWDTDRAVDLMALRTPEEEKFESLVAGDVSVDRIVDFDDFEVRRVKMAPKTTWQLEPERDYALVMAVTGELVVGGVVLRPEQAAMIPKGWTGEILNNFSECEMCFLLAYPSLG